MIGVDYGGKDGTFLTTSKPVPFNVGDLVTFEGHKYRCLQILTSKCVEIGPFKRPSRGYARHIRKKKSALRRSNYHRSKPV